MGSQLKTIALLGVLSALAIGAASVFSPQWGLVAGAVVLVMNFVSYFYSDRIVLRMHNARELTQAEAPDLFSINQELAAAAGIPAPRLYVIEADYANAFATGRGPGHAAIAVTSRLVNGLTRPELRGVLAHEMSHVANRDILIATVAAMLAAVVSMVANMLQWSMIFGGGSRNSRDSNIGELAFAILAPVGAAIVQMAISRSREYAADATGSRMTRDPESLASALERLSADAKAPHYTAPSPATASLFIVNPFANGGLMKLFSTHPPMEERIKRLRALAPQYRS
jgi:heat shock protein HtpX